MASLDSLKHIVAQLPVAERFVSINGEGPRAGMLAAFVRFVGCNLNCSYCDTRWAKDPACPAEWLYPEEIAAWVFDQGIECVTLTGGEPLIHPAMPQVVETLVAGASERGAALTVEIETNGSVDIARIDAMRRALDEPERVTFTLDCKLSSSEHFGDMLFENYSHLLSQDAVKFVAGSQEDLLAAEGVMREHDLMGKCSVFLSPVFGEIEPAEIVEFMRERGLAGVRLQLQLHKIIWPGQEKGV